MLYLKKGSNKAFRCKTKQEQLWRPTQCTGGGGDDYEAIKTKKKREQERKAKESASIFGCALLALLKSLRQYPLCSQTDSKEYVAKTIESILNIFALEDLYFVNYFKAKHLLPIKEWNNLKLKRRKQYFAPLPPVNKKFRWHRSEMSVAHYDCQHGVQVFLHLYHSGLRLVDETRQEIIRKESK